MKLPEPQEATGLPPMTTVLLQGKFHSELAWCCSIKKPRVLTSAVPTEANAEEGRIQRSFRGLTNLVMLEYMYAEG